MREQENPIEPSLDKDKTELTVVMFHSWHVLCISFALAVLYVPTTIREKIVAGMQLRQ